MPLTTRLALAGLLATLAGCAGAAKASNRDTLSEANVAQCRSLCESAGGTLQSIVIVANRTGCVCGLETAPSLDAPTGAAAGGAVVALIEEEERRRQDEQRRQQQQK